MDEIVGVAVTDWIYGDYQAAPRRIIWVVKLSKRNDKKHPPFEWQEPVANPPPARGRGYIIG